MAARAMQRSGLPLLFLAAFVLAAGVVITLFLVSPFSDGFLLTSRPPHDSGSGAPVTPPPDAAGEQANTVVSSSEETTAAEAQSSQASPSEAPAVEVEVSRETEPAGPERQDVPARTAARDGGQHMVVRGDTLYDLAGRYWSDPYLWPVLFVANEDVVHDPDLLRPGSVLVVPSGPGTTADVVAAHIAAHLRYRTLSDEALSVGRARGNPLLVQLGLIRRNKARWVLYSGLRYDRGLLDAAEGTVSAEDIEVVRGFIRSYGPAPGVSR